RQEQLAVGAELVDLVADRRAGTRTDRTARRLAARASTSRRRAAPGRTGRAAASAARRQRGGVLAVGHPDVAVAVDMNPVREDEHARAEARYELAVRVELENRRQVGHL